MRKIASMFMTLALALIGARAATQLTAVTLNVQDQYGSNWSKMASFAPVQTLLQDGPMLVALSPFSIRLTNGSMATNLHPADYTVQLEGIPKTFRTSVPATNVTWNLVLSATNLVTYTYTNPPARLTTNASDLVAGTLPNGRFPATLPAASGANLTALNGSQVTSGTVPDARLSANVPLKDAANTFSADNTFGRVIFNNVLLQGAASTWSVSESGGVFNLTTNNSPGSLFRFGSDGTLTAQHLAGTGSGITGLNASSLASGTVADGRLSANVALKGSVNVMTASNAFNGSVVITNSTAGTNTIYIDGASIAVDNGTYHFQGITNINGTDVFVWTKSAWSEPWLVYNSDENVAYAISVGPYAQVFGFAPDFYSECGDPPYRMDLICDWFAIDPEETPPSVHTFGFALVANGVAAGNGGGLSNITAVALSGNVNASQIAGSIPSSALPLATLTNAGVIQGSNDYAFLRQWSGQQQNIERVPWLGQWGNTFFDASNIIYWASTISPNIGYRVMGDDLGYYSGGRTNGAGVSVNSGASPMGAPVWNYTKYPGGPAYYRNFLHANGWRFMVWYDSINWASNSFIGTHSLPQMMFDVHYIATNWQPDIFWFDGTDELSVRSVSEVCTNNNIQLMLAVSPLTATNQAMTRNLGLANAWRIHGSYADMSTWRDALDYLDQMDSYGWRYTGPGRCSWPGYLTGGFGNTGTRSLMVAEAMFSGHIIETFVPTLYAGYAPIGDSAFMTNKNFISIQQDPAVVCARRVVVSNDCCVLLKPLGTPNGPDFALAVINTNAGASKSVTLPWAALNNGLQQTSLLLRDETYSVFDLKAGSWVGDAQSQVVVSSLGAQDYQWFKLVSTNRVPVVRLPGITTNVTATFGTPSGSFTMYFTNGVLMKFQ